MSSLKVSIGTIIAVIGCCLGIAAVYRFMRGRQSKKAEEPEARPAMEFEFGETRESEAFFDRNPKFMPAFLRLMEVANKYLGNRAQPKNPVEKVCFGLGHACRQDFLEVVFLAVNGYGVGASNPAP
jgi:hypothetical protein